MDLSRANLSGAHLFNTDLRGSNLFKAQLEDANLNHARLEGADLLGTDLHDTKLENVDWGARARQDAHAREALGAGRGEEARALFREAEEIYRNLSKESEERGHFRSAGRFFYREMMARRMRMRRWSSRWAVSRFMDLLCGYGELPARVIAFSLAMIVVSALLFLFLGVSGGGNPLFSARMPALGKTWARSSHASITA